MIAKQRPPYLQNSFLLFAMVFNRLLVARAHGCTCMVLHLGQSGLKFKLDQLTDEPLSLYVSLMRIPNVWVLAFGD
jgi:hypothetical protein